VKSTVYEAPHYAVSSDEGNFKSILYLNAS